jgi:hypothetical protein
MVNEVTPLLHKDSLRFLFMTVLYAEQFVKDFNIGSPNYKDWDLKTKMLFKLTYR